MDDLERLAVVYAAEPLLGGYVRLAHESMRRGYVTAASAIRGAVKDQVECKRRLLLLVEACGGTVVKEIPQEG